MSGEKNILRSLLPRKINRPLNIIGAIRKSLMRRPALDAFLSRSRNVRDSIVPAIVEHKNCRFRVDQPIRDSKFAEHRASKPVHPNNDRSWFLYPKPQSVQDKLLRRRYFDDMSWLHR